MGKVHIYGDNINTDLIIAGKYTKTKDCAELAAHCLEDLDETFRERVKQGDILVAGCNFGCGSSREQAPLALKSVGLSAILAKSYARIFYRNAINIGLPAIVCDVSRIKPGDEVSIDYDNGTVIINEEQVIPCQAFPPIMQSILSAGGLTAYLNQFGSF